MRGIRVIYSATGLATSGKLVVEGGVSVSDGGLYSGQAVQISSGFASSNKVTADGHFSSNAAVTVAGSKPLLHVSGGLSVYQGGLTITDQGLSVKRGDKGFHVL